MNQGRSMNRAMMVLAVVAALCLGAATQAFALGIGVGRSPAPPAAIVNDGAHPELYNWQIEYSTTPDHYIEFILDPHGVMVKCVYHDLSGWTENLVAPWTQCSYVNESATWPQPSPVAGSSLWLPAAGAPLGRYEIRIQFFSLQGGETWEAEGAVTFYVAQATGGLRFLKYNDLDADGVRDAGEPGIAGWRISFKDPFGTSFNRLTDASGLVTEAGVPIGKYEVWEGTKVDWTNSTPIATSGMVLTDQVTPFEFGNYRTGSIGDTVWFDNDKDAFLDADENGIEGVQVKLLMDADDDGTFESLIATETTDAYGWYLFDSLPTGNYLVDVDEATLPPGQLVLTTPPEPKEVPLAPEENFLDADFGYYVCVPETCNGLDDDCDGEVDEDFPLGQACDGTDSDLCANGHFECTPQVLCRGAGCTAEPVVCANDVPSDIQEVCDGADNDCDGETDEGFGVGDACDGTDSDECENGTLTCTADGTGTECVNETVEGMTEVCNAFDDDCDGAVDEDFPLGQACDGPDSDLCPNGVLICAPAMCRDPSQCPSTTVLCSDETPSDVVEVCDLVDNDCDGSVDEELGTTTCGLGVCTITVENCVDGELVPCSPPAAGTEVCDDGLDNDCDGNLDENCFCPRTIGYWKTHEEAWPVEEITIGGVTYSKADAIDTILKQANSKDATKMLAAQLVAAKLNVLSGGPLSIQGVIDDADAFLVEHPYGSDPKGADRDYALSLKDQLDAYNSSNDYPWCECEPECAGGECGPDGCGGSCGNCADGWECAADQSCVCVPVDEICDGKDNDCDTAIDEGLGSTTCGVGACVVSVDNCVGGQVQVCLPGTPGTEVCDLVDNDCDGVADEDLGVSTCGVGACSVAVLNCVDGQVQECVPGTPTAETCDLLDNDCDGVADEDLGTTSCGVGECLASVDNCIGGVAQTCVPGLPGTEVCDDRDNDCDGLADEDLGTTTCGIGECVVTVDNCVGGVAQTCVPGLPGTEVCDGRDNDCDGVADEDLGTTTCGVGECLATVENCAGGEAQACVPGEATIEECDLKDNDCDGATDEDLGTTTCGVGECLAAVENCVDGVVQTCVPGTPVVEICDSKDNDCDQLVDEDLGNTTCGVGACQATVENCVGGQTQECVPGSATEETCDLIDNDCDGFADDDLGSTTCGVGECVTTVQNCVGGVPQTCVPGNPVVEICDSKDNDCDGAADEDLGTTTCGVGACIVTVDNCVGGTAQDCVPGTGTDEVCDLLDNDCDGSVDEGLGTITCGTGTCIITVQNCVDGQIQNCVPGNPEAEICDSLDNDCDGLVDEDLGTVTCGVGACVMTVAKCVDGRIQDCVPGRPMDETCNLVDDDCDGLVDEELGTTECGVGECHVTVTNCVDGKVQVCVPGTPEPEVCEGMDNDCDGETDEDLGTTTCGVGECLHTIDNCVGGVPQVCDPFQGAAEELCDGLDNDCDGTTDEVCGKIGDLVFWDKAGNGAYNAGDEGLDGVTVQLLQGGVVKATTTTAAGGAYLFDNMEAGTYQVKVLPATLPAPGAGNAWILTFGTNPHSVVLGPGQVYLAADFGYFKAMPCADVEKSGPSVASPGQTITYHFKICNCGNTVLGGGLQVQDPMLGGKIWHKTTQPGECNEFDVNYTIPANAAAPYCNTATAIGCPPYGLPNVTDTDTWCIDCISTPEVCDGLDNDCDGTADEGLGTTACGVGACTVTVDNCVGGAPQACVPATPTGEKCDLVDNDCDGLVDEDLGVATCGTGLCANSVAYCVAGKVQTCVPGAPTFEVCDGLDNDCDGQTDENCGDDDCELPAGCVTLAEAFARDWIAFGNASPATGTITVYNLGSAPVCLDEHLLFVSDPTQTFTNGTQTASGAEIQIPAGGKLSLQYAPWTYPNGTYAPYLNQAPWWCVEYGQYSTVDTTFYYFGEMAPAAVSYFIDEQTDVDGDGKEDHIDWAGDYGTQSLYNIWNYLMTHASLTAGKTAFAAGPATVEVALTTRNIGALAGAGVLSDVIPAGYAADNFSIDPDGSAVQADGSTVLYWNVALEGAEDPAGMGGTMLYDFVEITYDLHPALSANGKRLELPRAMIDFNDGDSDETGESALVIAVNVDVDGDGFPACADCDDGEASTFPGGTEICDGVDNDCDGETDEGFDNLGQECSAGIGACFASGEYVCTADGLGTTCSALPGAPTDEVCDLIDNDCDTLVDEDLGSTTCGVGACLTTVQNCIAGLLQVCTPAAPGVEACDLVDNDCDGLVDEELGTTECGLGECHVTVTNCVNGQVQTCVPGTPEAEFCDAMDNDCDGATDEDLGTTTCGTGVCLHTIDNCVGGVPQVCDPFQGASAELCDGMDNDCDGITDEACGAIGDLVFLDKTGNGSYGPDDEGIGGVTVQLLQGGAVIGTTTTAADGKYLFQNLAAGTYQVKVLTATLPAPGAGNSWILTFGTNPHTAVLAAGQVYLTADFGYFKAMPCADVEKTGPSSAAPGQTIKFHFKICNCGNTVLGGGLQVQDPMLGGKIWHKTTQPGECNEFDVNYTIPANATGPYCNTATAIGCPPYGLPNVTDKDTWCIDCIAKTETCDGKDNDCDGLTDENLGTTTCGVGACIVTTENCVGGAPVNCVPGTPQPELCDLIDNDCDGALDDGLGTTTCGAGVCKKTTDNCVNGQTQTCVPGTPGAEVCDGLDNDCDGVIDEGFGTITCGLGACEKTIQKCVNGQIQVCKPDAPTAELCKDQIDNDCDGAVDEGCGGDDCELPPDCVSLAEAFARDWIAIVTPSSTSDSVTFHNLGTAPVCLDEHLLFLSDPTQSFTNGIKTAAGAAMKILPGAKLTMRYAPWTFPNGVYNPYLYQAPWWCVEYGQLATSNTTFGYYGEQAPPAIAYFIDTNTNKDGDGKEDHVDWAGPYGTQALYNIWNYQITHAVLTAGKVAGAAGQSNVAVVLTAHNIGALPGTGVLADNIPAGFAASNYSVEPDGSINEPDGSTTVFWNVALQGSEDGPGMTGTTVFDVLEIYYDLTPALSANGKRLVLPRAKISYSDGTKEQIAQSAFVVAINVDVDGDGFAACGDCDDGEYTVYPGAEEICDGLDNDCNGEIDEGCPVCGNGLIEDGEICDQGDENANEPGLCQTDCTLSIMWPSSGQMTIAWEDLPAYGGNDWDYNDWIIELEVEYIFNTEGATQMRLYADPWARGAAYHHSQGLAIAMGTLTSEGAYTVKHYDTDWSFMSAENPVDFTPAQDLAITMFNDTWETLPANHIGSDYGYYSFDANTESGYGIVLGPKSGIEFEFDVPLPLSPSLLLNTEPGTHGENMPFDLYLLVGNTGEYIANGDTRFLCVPDFWDWPAEKQSIWTVYAGAQPAAGGPIFEDGWYYEPAIGETWYPGP